MEPIQASLRTVPKASLVLEIDGARHLAVFPEVSAVHVDDLGECIQVASAESFLIQNAYDFVINGY